VTSIAALVLLAVFVAALGLTVVKAVRADGGSGDGSDGADGGGGGGGGGVRPPGGGPPVLPGADPEWWPQFEREFAAHAARVEGESERDPAVAPGAAAPSRVEV
jgi:hypothetical protein